MLRRPPTSPRTYTLFPSPTRFRSLREFPVEGARLDHLDTRGIGDHQAVAARPKLDVEALKRLVQILPVPGGIEGGHQLVFFLADIAVETLLSGMRFLVAGAGCLFLRLDFVGAAEVDLQDRKSTRLNSSNE